MVWANPLVLSDFRARYPEFENASDTLVNQALDDAMLEVNEDIFADAAQAAGHCYAAKILAISPFGLQARLAAGDGESTYSKRWLRLARAYCGGPRVT